MKIITASKIASAPLNASGLMWLEKAEGGQVTVDDIGDALQEFSRLFKAGIASKAEKLTLARAFPENRQYTEAAAKVGDDEPMVVGGPASVSLIDREGHLITTEALKKAFTKFMDNFRTRNAMVLHSDVQVGWALPAYITKGGQIFKSGVDDKGLFFICELRDDTKISEKVMKEISEGRLKSYSIAGSALKVQNMQKGLVPYMQVDDMELAEVTVCEKGVNQNAGFELLKAEMPQTGKIDKDQCDYRDATMEETMRGENCGHCKFFNAEDKTCDTVTGDIQPGDWCKIFAPMEQQPKHAKVVVVMRDNEKVDFKKSFDMWMEKTETVKDPLKAKESIATLQNFAGREKEHHQLLREYGFPSEQPSESARYTPVIETETDDDGIPRNIVGPWVVNEAGQDLGEKLDEDAPSYNQSEKAKNRKSGDAVQKMGFLFKAPSDDERRDADTRRSGPRGRIPAGQSASEREARIPRADAEQVRKIQRQRGRTGSTVPFQPAPGYVDSPRGRAEAAGASVRDAAESQAAFQRRAQELSPTARRTLRQERTRKTGERQRYFNRPTAVDPQNRTTPRGASFTGAPGQKKAKTAADIQREKQEAHEAGIRRMTEGIAQQRQQRVDAKKQQAGEESRARRGGFKGALTRAKQRAGRATERGMETARRIGGQFGTGVKSGMTSGKLEQGRDEKGRRTALPTASKRGREVGRGVAGLWRGFKDRPTNEAGDYMSYQGEGKTGKRARQVGRGGRKVYDWASGQMPFFSDEAKAKRETERTFAGSAVQPGGMAGRNMDYDGHVGEFKAHNERVQSTGNDTQEGFLHNLQRLGMTKDNQRMFNVRHGKHIGSKMQDDMHSHDFLAGEGKDWDIEIHPDFAQHADEIHAYLNEYKTHMSGAPGKGQGAQLKPGASSQNMEWTTPQTEQPAAAPQPQTPNPNAPQVQEIGSSQTAIGGAGGPKQTALSGTAQARKLDEQFKQSPEDVNVQWGLKSVKKSTIDVMLLKALGVRYVTK